VNVVHWFIGELWYRRTLIGGQQAGIKTNHLSWTVARLSRTVY